MTKICLYAICGDNERDVDLDRWFECAREADGAVVLFTGESQSMYDKLEERALKSSHIHLRQQTIEPMFRFDVARNESIELAESLFPTFDVFFTIDMDEWMEPGWTDVIKDRWRDQHQRISYSHRHFQAEKPASRNWGHAKGWRWKYPCHEVMIRGYQGEIWYNQLETLNLDYDLEVVHFRDPAKPRGSYLPLLETRWDENKNPESLTYLIREYMYHRMYDEIISKAGEVREFCVSEGTESCMGYCVLGDAYEHKGRDAEAEICYDKAVELGSMLRRGYIEYGRFLIKHDEAPKALEILEDGLKKTVFSQHGIFVDPSDAWTWRYWDWLCVAAYWSNEPVKAMKYALNAYDADPGNEHVKKNVKESWMLLERGL